MVRTNVKLNLGLSVLRRRPDGYHDLETLFIPYHGFGDDLEINEAAEFSADIKQLRYPGRQAFSPQTRLDGAAASPDVMAAHASHSSPAPAENLAPCSWDPMSDLTVRAYDLLRTDFNLPPVAIRLVKGAPVGAGLGGGSADGAFALRMLSELFGLGLSDDALAAYAARLGSDCPFFIYNRPMIGEGRGEVLTPFDIDLSAWEIRVEVPAGISVSTREAYSGVTPRESRPAAGPSNRSSCPSPATGNPVPSSIPRETAPDSPMSLREALSQPVEEWRRCLLNDFEPSVFAAHPALAALKASFYASGATYASMSGSGSAIFGLFPRR